MSFLRQELFRVQPLGVLLAFSFLLVNEPNCWGRVWDAGGDGISWEDRCNWSGNEGFPACLGQQPFGGDDATIPFGHSVRSAVLFDVGLLSVGPPALLDIQGALSVFEGVTNEGDIAITGGLGIGEFNPNNTLLQGGGEVILANSNFLNPARLNGASFVASHVTHAAGNTIRGEGLVSGKWINDGLIRAEETSGDLSAVLAINGTMANNGVIRSSATGMMRLESATLTMGASGQLIADGQPIVLGAATIIGGSIDGINGSKLVRLDSGGATVLSGVTLNGDFDVLVNNASVHGAGTGITNNGTMTFDNIGLQSHLSLESGVTLGGTGTVILNSESDLNNGVRIIGGPFTHGANHTIRGVGAVRANFVNHGTILAEPRNGTLLRLNAGGTNDGLIQASTGATLRIDGESSVTQSVMGRIRAADGGTIEMPNNTVTGGRIETEGSGLIVATGATLTDVTNTGRIHVPASFDILRLAGPTFTNQGEVVVNPSRATTSFPPTLRFQTDITLEGTGLIVLNQSPSGARMETWEANKVVTQAAGHTIRGNGLITWGTYINHGRLEGLSAAEPLVIDANLNGDGALKDILLFGKHTLGDAGTASVVTVEGSYEMGNGGRLLVDIGGLTPGIDYDQLKGNGPITISPTSNTRLEVTILPGFVPEPGDMFTVVTTSDSITGTISSSILPTNVSNRSLAWKPIRYTEHDMILEVLSVDPVSLPGDFHLDGFLTATDIDLLSAEIRNAGFNSLYNVNEDTKIDEQDRITWVRELRRTNFGDANLDGKVDFPDFLILSASFGKSGGWAQGDFNGNGDVDFPDFLFLSTNFGAPGASPAAVPEPTGLCLVGWGSLILRGFRRRRITRG